MKVYIIRHGESESNLSKRLTGWSDVPLTEKGKREARSCRRFLSQTRFDRIYTSDLVRARQTAEIAIPDCRYETTPCLREINVGSLAGRPLHKISAEESTVLRTVGYTAYGGESKDEFSERVRGFLRQLEALTCENVALFAHSGVLRSALEFVLETKLGKGTVLCNNCAIAVFEYQNGIWTLDSWINLPHTAALC